MPLQMGFFADAGPLQIFVSSHVSAAASSYPRSKAQHGRPRGVTVLHGMFSGKQWTGWHTCRMRSTSA
jgi:hypothetical protein